MCLVQAEANAKLAVVRREIDLLKTLNESLVQNTDTFKKQMLAAEESAKEAKARVSELEDQVIHTILLTLQTSNAFLSAQTAK